MKLLKTICVFGIFPLGGFVSLVEAQENVDTAVIGTIYRGSLTLTFPHQD